MGLPRFLSSKNSPCNAGDQGSSPGLGRSPGGGHGNPLQYSCLENLMDIRAWQATVHRLAESDTTEVTEHTGTHAGELVLPNFETYYKYTELTMCGSIRSSGIEPRIHSLLMFGQEC